MKYGLINLPRFFRIVNSMFPIGLAGLFVLKVFVFGLNLQKKDYLENK